MIRNWLSALLAGILLMPAGVLAQGNQGGGTDQAGRGTGPQQGSEQAVNAEAQTALVGAGTTDNVTTGASGPDQSTASTDLPPPPGAELCNAYRDTPAHPWCLSVVLRQSGTPSPAAQ